MPDRVHAGTPGHRGYVPLVEIWRGDTVESVHFGAIAVVEATGAPLASAGDPGTVTFLRSAAKPAQALPLIEAGGATAFGFTQAEIAVIAGSHGGEPFHVEAVRSILRKIGLPESALQCGAHPPYNQAAARALRRAGLAPSAVHNNCSGKHAGMLALAVLLKAPVDSYLDPGHPVQVRIRAAVELLAGLPPGGARLATDGCSAPSFAMPIAGAALMYARLVDPSGPPAEHRAAAREVVAAMRHHPEMVAGTDRVCTELMRERADDLVAKIGAEGFYGLGWAVGGRSVGIALKIADGDGQRARYSVAIEILRQIGALPSKRAALLRTRFVGDLKNHRGLAVGHVATLFDLGSPLVLQPPDDRSRTSRQKS